MLTLFLIAQLIGVASLMLKTKDIADLVGLSLQLEQLKHIIPLKKERTTT
jgi:hypothetical protein